MRAPQPLRTQKERGETLIEILISIVILSIGERCRNAPRGRHPADDLEMQHRQSFDGLPA
jgi:prepilin-type N-terminal cleavage/methylation domain-containing protein